MYNGRLLKKSCSYKYDTKIIIISMVVAFVMHILIETGKAPIIPFDF